MRRAALVTLLCYGCATVRPPSTPDLPLAGSAPARVAFAEPELELWVEGTREIDAAESSRTLDEGRAALAAALVGRGGSEGEGADALVSVRVRAVARTKERRTAQIWSAVGIVAVAAVVVATIILSRDRARPRHAGIAAAPRPSMVPVRGFRPRPVRAGPPSFFWGWSVGVHVAAPLHAHAAQPDIEPIGEPDALLDERGWFAGDEAELTAELVDAASGDVRWRRTVRGGVDPRDPAAVRDLLDRALADAPFTVGAAAGVGTTPRAAGGPPAPPRAAPPPNPSPDGVDL